jgi:hypothetical protein
MRSNGSPFAGNKKVGEFSSSDFGALANQPIFTVPVKIRFTGEKSQAPNWAEIGPRERPFFPCPAAQAPYVLALADGKKERYLDRKLRRNFPIQ